MKTLKSIIAVVLTVVLFASFSIPVHASVFGERRSTLGEYLEANGICFDGNTTITVVTKADESQYIQIVRNLDGGFFESSFLTGYQETKDGLVPAKIIDSISFSKYVVSRASTVLEEPISSISITMTVTAYYTGGYIWDVGYRISPSGVTAKWSRTSGSNTVSYMNAYFTITGDLYDLDENLVTGDYFYSASISQYSPAIFTYYSDYATLPPETRIEPRGTGSMDEPLLGFYIIVNGNSYGYSVNPIPV
ncbi:MAG: hypothetical protein GX811_09445 [Lentisphaerae bacterium]|nr:hypothetical protein [Lentisphaerota bacterium]NLV50406.1 hypothetical protein [Clostridiales bacterium]